MLGHCFVTEESQGTAFKEKVGVNFLQVPHDWVNTEGARMPIDVRDHLRAVLPGRAVAEQVVPEATADIAMKVPLGTHASRVSNSTSASARPRRWVDDRESRVDIEGEGTTTSIEDKHLEETQIPMRLITAIGEVVGVGRRVGHEGLPEHSIAWAQGLGRRNCY